MGVNGLGTSAPTEGHSRSDTGNGRQAPKKGGTRLHLLRIDVSISETLQCSEGEELSTPWEGPSRGRSQVPSPSMLPLPRRAEPLSSLLPPQIHESLRGKPAEVPFVTRHLERLIK